MNRVSQKAAGTPPAAFSALWVGRADYYGATPDGRVIARSWPTPPACDDPAKLIAWAVRTAGLERAGAGALSILLAPDVAGAFGIPAELPKTAETLWEKELTGAGWRCVSRGTYGPWTVIQDGAKRIEVGICVVPWVPTALRARAAHGVVHDAAGAPDPFETMYVHAQYRAALGWPLSGGAGMAGVKALRFAPRKKEIYWAPPEAAWHDLEFLHPPQDAGHTGRSDQRPWHQYWSMFPELPVPPDPALTHVVVWDQTTAYLTAWAAARLARGMLIHTGPGVRPNPKGTYPAGYYRITEIAWSPRLAPIVARLPPITGSRRELADGSVWVTHEIIDALAALDSALPDYAPVAAVTILDSWTCEDHGQLAKDWGAKVRRALAAARAEAAGTDDQTCRVLALAVKATYAQGYPLAERSGIMRRPDHVDALIDHMVSFGRFVRLVLAAVRHGLYPLDVSADEVTMLSRPDPGPAGVPLAGPLSREAGDTTFVIKPERDGSPRMATLEQWEQAHTDGRGGRWWLETSGARPGVPRPRDAAPVPAVPESPLMSYMMGDD